MLNSDCRAYRLLLQVIIYQKVIQGGFKLHLFSHQPKPDIFIFCHLGVETRETRVETTTLKVWPQSALLARSQTRESMCKDRPRGKTTCTRWSCPLRTSRVIYQSHPSSPGQWPLPDSCCYCWWARPNTAAVSQPCWLRQARENTASFWLCADGKSSAQTNVRTIIWAVSKHPPASNCFYSGRIHFFFFPIWGTSKGGALRNLKDVYIYKYILSIKLFQSSWFSYTGAPLTWLLHHFNFDASLAFVHSTRGMKCFSSSFFLAVLWTTPGIWTVAFLSRGKKMAGVTANGISRMRFGIFSFMRPARCYLAV